MIIDYKKIIENQTTRFFILKCLRFIPDKIMLQWQYKLKLGRKIDFKKPKRFTEKIQLYKMYYRNPLLSKCVDKFLVRDYVKQKGLENILNELYVVADEANEIDYSKLPDKFVIKTTDGSGGENIIICTDKKELDQEICNRNLNHWKNKKSINAGREWAYTGIKKSRIIVEKYLENSKNLKSGVEDYKFLCYQGIPKYVIIDKNRYINHQRNFYTIDKKNLYVSSDHDQFDENYDWPENYEDMVKIASKLSEDFPFVRVDLYNIDGKIIFGELTFYPWSGYVQFSPDSFDFELGSHFNIDTIRAKPCLNFS